MATFPGRNHRALYPLVLTLSLELSGFVRNDGGAWVESRSQHDRTMGAGLRAGTGKAGQAAQLKPTNDSWKVDETYLKVKGEWLYQYRAVDSDGQTIEFFLSAKRDAV